MEAFNNAPHDVVKLSNGELYLAVLDEEFTNAKAAKRWFLSHFAKDELNSFSKFRSAHVGDRLEENHYMSKHNHSANGTLDVMIKVSGTPFLLGCNY